MDTGAVFNLTGDAWLHRMSEHLPKELPIQYEELQEPQGVMGVGQHASTATHVAAVPMGMAEQGIEPDENFKYKATVITNSDVPALLGLQSMIASNCILDLRPGKTTCTHPRTPTPSRSTFHPRMGTKWDVSRWQQHNQAISCYPAVSYRRCLPQLRERHPNPAPLQRPHAQGPAPQRQGLEFPS